MNNDSFTQCGSTYIEHFFNTVCCETSSAFRVLSQLYPDGAKCASCGSNITGRRASETFWRGDRTYCAACNSKFSPRSNTILSDSHLTYSQYEVILVLQALGVDHKRISAMTGVHPDTVAIWHSKIKFWETHV